MEKCAVCETGKHEDWGIGKTLCEEHNVCITCGIKRKDLKTTAWGVRFGAFMCGDCSDREKKERITERIKNGFDHEYTDEIVCPQCGHEQEDSWEHSEGEEHCCECDTVFEVERITTVEYTTYIKETPND